MKVTTSLGSVHIGWQYTICTKELDNKKEPKTIQQDCTICFIRDSAKNELVDATIHRYHIDDYNKQLSRKLAFETAIKIFSKEDRKLLWDTFLKEVKIK